MRSKRWATTWADGSTRSRTIFERELRAEATRERVVDRLHAELQEYKQDFLLKVQRPIFIDLIQLHDDIGKMIEARHSDRRPEPTAGRVRGVLESIQTAIEDILYRQGVEPFSRRGRRVRSPASSARSRPRSTDDPARNKTVAARLRKGFQAGDKLIRPEIVTVFTLRQPPPDRGSALDRWSVRSPRSTGLIHGAASGGVDRARPNQGLERRLVEVLAVERDPQPRAELGQVGVEDLAQPRGQIGRQVRAARSVPARTPSSDSRPAPRDDPLPERGQSTGACTSASRIGLGAAAPPLVLRLQRRSPTAAGPRWPRNRPIRSSSACESMDQPREEDRQHVLEAIGIQERLQLHGVAAVLDQLGMPLDRLAQADRDPAGRHLMDVLRDQPVDRMPHHVDQLEPRQVAHHPLDRPRIGRKLGVVRARLAAQVRRPGRRGTASEYQRQPRAIDRRRR